VNRGPVVFVWRRRGCVCWMRVESMGRPFNLATDSILPVGDAECGEAARGRPSWDPAFSARISLGAVRRRGSAVQRSRRNR